MLWWFLMKDNYRVEGRTDIERSTDKIVNWKMDTFVESDYKSSMSNFDLLV